MIHSSPTYLMIRRLFERLSFDGEEAEEAADPAAAGSGRGPGEQPAQLVNLPPGHVVARRETTWCVWGWVAVAGVVCVCVCARACARARSYTRA